MIRADARLLQSQCLAQQPFRRDMVATRLSLLDSLHDRPEIMDIWHRHGSIVNGHTMGAHSKTMNADDRLELFFSQSLDGFFFMMIDEPVVWDDSIDKERVLDYVFEHQRMTKVNDAMLAQYGATRESFLGTTPKDLFRHDLAHGRRVWREFFDRGRLHIETDERRVDGAPIRIEGDYLCFYDEAGRITGHFGIQRDVTERERASQALRQYNRRLQVLHDIHLDILGTRSPQQIAEATLRHLQELIPCRRASVAVFDLPRGTGTIIASWAMGEAQERRRRLMVRWCRSNPSACARNCRPDWSGVCAAWAPRIT